MICTKDFKTSERSINLGQPTLSALADLYLNGLFSHRKGMDPVAMTITTPRRFEEATC